MDTLQLD
jgi:hypothetical protein